MYLYIVTLITLYFAYYIDTIEKNSNYVDRIVPISIKPLATLLY